MNLNPELKDSNYEIFKKKLTSLNSETLDVTPIIEKYGDLLKNASYATTNENGAAIEGSLIEVVLKYITLYAVKINEILPEALRVDKTTLVKVCLLHQISKCIRLIPNDNDWEIKNRGMNFKFNPELPVAVGTGLHSVILLNELGIKLTPEEVEAMTIIDRDIADKQAKYYCTTLSSIVRQANELAQLHIAKLN